MSIGSLRRSFLRLPLSYYAVLALTLGLAPFAPPHLYEKAMLLAQGKLTRPIDWFDLALHAAPWILLAARSYAGRGNPQKE